MGCAARPANGKPISLKCCLLRVRRKTVLIMLAVCKLHIQCQRHSTSAVKLHMGENVLPFKNGLCDPFSFEKDYLSTPEAETGQEVHTAIASQSEATFFFLISLWEQQKNLHVAISRAGLITLPLWHTWWQKPGNSKIRPRPHPWLHPFWEKQKQKN